MSNNTFYPYAPYQQYQAAAGATPYPQMYTGQESYAGVAAQAAYHQAWYNYAYQQAQQQQARQMAPVPTAPMQTVMSTTPAPVVKTTSPAPVVANSASPTTNAAPPAPKPAAQTTTFSAYTPPHSRSEAGHSFSNSFQASMGTAGSSLGSRASRKSQMRGIFSKEREHLFRLISCLLSRRAKILSCYLSSISFVGRAREPSSSKQ